MTREQLRSAQGTGSGQYRRTLPGIASSARRCPCLKKESSARLLAMTEGAPRLSFPCSSPSPQFPLSAQPSAVSRQPLAVSHWPLAVSHWPLAVARWHSPPPPPSAPFPLHPPLAVSHWPLAGSHWPLAVARWHSPPPPPSAPLPPAPAVPAHRSPLTAHPHPPCTLHGERCTLLFPRYPRLKPRLGGSVAKAT